MSTAYQIIVCAGIVPDPLQTLEPVASLTGPELNNEMMLPAVLDPWTNRGGRGQPFVNPNGIQILQPRVARNELPWVTKTQVPSTLKGLDQSHTYRSSNWIS
jgi:hypothetical protein